MSQKSSLSVLCEENKDQNDIIDKLFTNFSEELDYHVKAKILNSLVQIYLLHFKDLLETNIKIAKFLGLLSQIPLLCRKFLLTSSFESNSKNKTICVITVEEKKENLESASLCFDVAHACLKAFCDTKQCLVLVKISLNILCQGYTHCKESEIIYGDYLEQFTNQLGCFFKKIENLQLIVLQQLDMVDVTKYSGDYSYINCIAIEMGNLCQIVFSLDADIAFELWTKYIKIVTDHRSLMQISNINPVSTYLASKNIEVLEMIKYNVDKNSEEVEELCAKFFFYLDALSSMLNLYHESFKENISVFRIFLLNLFDCLVSSYSLFNLEKSCLNIVKKSLEKNTFILLSYLYTDEGFLKSVLLTAPDKQNHISVYLLKLCALQFMKCTPLLFKENFFKDILSNFLSGSPEDNMKLVCISIPQSTLTEANSNEPITLYQLAYDQLTEFSKLLPDTIIKELESIIVNCLVSSSNVVYLLISDVWIYRLRCSSIEFLNDRCHTIVKHYCMKNANNIKIENLLKRMMKFLPHVYQDMLLKEFNDLKTIIGNKDIEHRYGVPDLTSTENEICVDSEEVKMMISKLNEDSSNNVLHLVQKACICLELCALFVYASETSEILQFIEFASEMFNSDVYEIQIAVLTFIRALSRKNVQEHAPEFGKIVTCLVQLFSSAIHSKNYIVKYEARNVFSFFAKCTPHIKIVQETVRQDPSLKPAMKTYINAVPDNFLPSKDKSGHLKKQILTSNDIKFEIPKSVIESLQNMFLKGINC